MKLKARIAGPVMLLVLLLSGCPGPDYTGVTVTGTVDLAAVDTAGTCYVVLENDAYAPAAEISGAYPANGSYIYTLSNVLEGRYYLRVWLDFGVDGVADEERYYDNSVLPTPPASPNVTVPFSGTVSYDLTF